MNAGKLIHMYNLINAKFSFQTFFKNNLNVKWLSQAMHNESSKSDIEWWVALAFGFACLTLTDKS